MLIPLGIVNIKLLLGSICMVIWFVVMENMPARYFIVGNNYLVHYRISLLNNERCQFTIGKRVFDFDKSINAVHLQMGSTNCFAQEVARDAKILAELLHVERSGLLKTLERFKSEFETSNEPFGAIKGHKVEVTLTVENPYPLSLRKVPYPASLRNREAIEEHVHLFTCMGILRKVGANEGVDITTPVIIAWNNGKLRLVGDFRALNTYTTPDRYPMPKIMESLTKLQGARFLTCMDVLKDFQQNVVSEKSCKFLRIISHGGA